MKTSNRRKFLLSAILLGGGLAVTASPISRLKKNQLAHHVFFRLKNPESKADIDQLIKGIRTLKKIEVVNRLHVGVLASTEKRDVVDTNWQVSELLFFDDSEAQKIYQTHPIHLAFIKDYSHLWAGVVVYDVQEM